MATALTKKTFGKRAPDGAWEIPILGDLGFFGTNGEELIRELNAVKPKTVKFIIYSGGGAVYDAIAVAGFIREQGITCYAEIYGVCASAATVFAALAGPKNTAIAPGSAFLVHMPYGGDQKLIDNATAFLVDLYVSAYGWTKAEASKHMQADEGRGIFWTAKEAKSLGVCSEIMDVSAVAARLNVNPTAMADKKPTVKATVKLSLAQAIAAATTGTEVEVDAEQATTDALAEKDTRIAQLESELAEAQASKPAEGTVVPAEEVAKVEAKVKELEATIATNTTAIAAKDEELTKAQAKVKDLEAKIPAASRTIADNKDGKIGGMPGTEHESQGSAIIKQAIKNSNPLQLAQAKLNAERNKPAA